MFFRPLNSLMVEELMVEERERVKPALGSPL
jgi:hypothetical protein